MRSVPIPRAVWTVATQYGFLVLWFQYRKRYVSVATFGGASNGYVFLFQYRQAVRTVATKPEISELQKQLMFQYRQAVWAVATLVFPIEN